MSSSSALGKADKVASNTNGSGKGDGALTSLKGKKSRVRLIFDLPRRSTVVGKVLTCGQGDMGQLGLGDDEAKFERKRPALVDIPNAVEVEAGGMHNLVLTSEGDVYSFGCNDEGALGRDTSEEGSEFEPSIVELPGKAVKISAGDSHSATILENGKIYAWGSFRNSHGNMGLTLDGNKSEPFDLLPEHSIVSIASGADHLVMLTNKGKVFTIGCGEQGQLGRVSMRSASGDSRRGKTELLVPLEVYIKSRKPVSEIWATNYCTFMREHQSDNIYGFGLNNYHQLAVLKKSNQQIFSNPVLTVLKDVQEIAGGQHHTVVLKRNGDVLAIGRPDYGRLGLGKLESDTTSLTEIAQLKDKNIISIGCGEAQSFALGEGGELYAWGMGSSHQLGTGEEEDCLEPVHIVSAQTKERQIIRASGGGQHSIFLGKDLERPSKEKKDKTNVKVVDIKKLLQTQ